MADAVVPQYMIALEKANRVRLGRAKLRSQVGLGQVSVAEALEDEFAQTATIGELLCWQRRWGEVVLRKFMWEIGPGVLRLPDVEVGGLTVRQKRLIVEALVDRDRRKRKRRVRAV